MELSTEILYNIGTMFMIEEETPMPQINILSPHVADLIAAGEVVERPASVVKELLENAFDAGSGQVTVEIENGGATMIRITDNGCGMAPEDAGIAFLRHATSKLHDENGLDAITTMGFRGEALAAISSVSRIEMLTRRPEDDEGTRITLTAGEIQEMEPVGCPAGTMICVRDLFYNTPARLRFLKSDRSEASACVQTALRCALGRPDVSVCFIKDGKEEFFTPGDGSMESCCYALLGRESASAMLPVYSTDEGLAVRGLVSSPALGRGNRSAQYFFVNGRTIRSALLQSALEQAYRNTLLTGRYPACVLYLEILPGAVDVNVHPAKTEVRFTEERRIFSLVHQAVRDALLREDRLAGSDASSPVSTENSYGNGEAVPDFRQVSDEPADRADTAVRIPSAGTSAWNTSSGQAVLPGSGFRQEQTFADLAGKPLWDPAFQPETHRQGEPVHAVPHSILSEGDSSFSEEILPQQDEAFPAKSDSNTFPASSISRDYFISADPVKPSQPIDLHTENRPFEIVSEAQTGLHSETPVEKPVQNVDNFAVADHKIVGEAFRTYIIVEVGDKIILIDKHAAHERMNFDRLKAAGQKSAPQELLRPETLRVTPEAMALLEEYHALFEEFGFELEPFGRDEMLLRAIPSDILPEDAVSAVDEILDNLAKGGTPNPEAARDELLHTVACKAAIKAGWNTSALELERITTEVLSGRIRYCPHGRPVSVTVTRRELDRLFKRIV